MKRRWLASIVKHSGKQALILPYHRSKRQAVMRNRPVPLHWRVKSA
ncbi:hypothetical protein [Roseovarius azorensis]|nr:hypothetical protein [Roseovarius azorensis]